MINVLFVANTLGFGGAAKIISFVANNLEPENYRVTIFKFNRDESFRKMANYIDIIEYTGTNRRIIRRISQLKQLVKIIKQIKPDVIISLLAIPNVLAIIAGQLTHIPVIISERGDPYQNNKFFDKLFYWLYTYANGAVFQTEEARCFFNNKLRLKSCVIPNPVYISSKQVESVSQVHKDTIAFVARFDLHQKRHDIMLRAFRLVVNFYPNLILNFYGIGPDELKVQQIVHDLKLNNNVKFYGLVNDIPTAIKNSTMFVMTSDFEGIPNALIEAMSIGLPCISTDYSPGGIRELIDHGINGLVVPRGDVEKIAKAMVYILENPEAAELMGREAMKIKQKFPPEKILNQWKTYVDQVIGRTL